MKKMCRMKRVKTQVLKIDPQPIFTQIQQASGSVWNECLYQMDMYQWHRGYLHAHCDFYIGDACEGWMDQHLSKSQPLHSQSIQHIRKTYFRSWKSYAALKKSGGVRNPKPPRKTKKYMTTRWLKSAIHFKDELLSLSMGAGRDRLEIPLPKKFDMSKSHLISTIDLVYDFGQWALHFTYTDKINPESAGKGICSVDVGEIHPIVSNDGEHTEIYNGRYIRSLYRQRNKVLADFSRAMSRCDRRSKRGWRLTRRKWKRIRKIDNQIKDALNKHTTAFVRRCVSRGIGTIVLGDLTGIRNRIDYSKSSNQKLHQWAFGKLTDLITYKAKQVGIQVRQINEAYTSQTCPSCGERNKPSNRTYKCGCGFTYHRDGIGAYNIREKYLGHLGVPVVADMGNLPMKMTPPLGFRLEVPVASS